MAPIIAPLKVPKTGRMLPATAPMSAPLTVGENFDAFAQHLGEFEEFFAASKGAESKADDEFSVVIVLSIADEKEYLV